MYIQKNLQLLNYAEAPMYCNSIFYIHFLPEYQIQDMPASNPIHQSDEDRMKHLFKYL